MDFTGPVVGKAAVMAMCGEKSGGVVQVYIIPTIINRFNLVEPKSRALGPGCLKPDKARILI